MLWCFNKTLHYTKCRDQQLNSWNNSKTITLEMLDLFGCYDNCNWANVKGRVLLVGMMVTLVILLI